MDRQVTSPTWGPLPPCKQTLDLACSRLKNCNMQRSWIQMWKKKSQATCALFSRSPFHLRLCFNPFTAGMLDGDFKGTLAFESVDEILWCDHSNESSLPVLSHDAICFSKFQNVKFRNLVEICFWLNLAVKGLNYTGELFVAPRKAVPQGNYLV